MMEECGDSLCSTRLAWPSGVLLDGAHASSDPGSCPVDAVERSLQPCAREAARRSARYHIAGTLVLGRSLPVPLVQRDAVPATCIGVTESHGKVPECQIWALLRPDRKVQLNSGPPPAPPHAPASG